MDISIKEDNYKIMDIELISWIAYIMVHSVSYGQGRFNCYYSGSNREQYQVLMY